MDYTVFAKDLLKRKLVLETAYKAMGEELCELETEKTSTAAHKEVNISSKGTNKSEDRLINLIYRIDDVKFRRGVVERDLKLIDRGMSALNEYEKEIINGFFVTETKYAADKLMEKFYKERTMIYNDRSKALEKFTRAIYGMIAI